MATYAKILKDNAGNQILPYTRSELVYNKNLNLHSILNATAFTGSIRSNFTNYGYSPDQPIYFSSSGHIGTLWLWTTTTKDIPANAWTPIGYLNPIHEGNTRNDICLVGYCYTSSNISIYFSAKFYYDERVQDKNTQGVVTINPQVAIPAYSKLNLISVYPTKNNGSGEIDI